MPGATGYQIECLVTWEKDDLDTVPRSAAGLRPGTSRFAFVLISF